MRRCVLLLIAAVTCVGWLGCTSLGRRGGLAEEEVRTFPLSVQQSYDLFSHRCSRCHTLARPLNAQVDDVEHWRAYVARMRRQPGSGISRSDGDAILVFLEFYTRKDKSENQTELEGTP